MGGGESVRNVLTAVWPTAEVDVDVVYGRETEAADDSAARRREPIEHYEDRTGAVRSVEGVGMDAVVEPAETYGWMRRALDRYDEPSEEPGRPRSTPSDRDEPPEVSRGRAGPHPTRIERATG